MFPVEVVFRNMVGDGNLENRIIERAHALAKVHGRIEWCRVVVDRPHQHHVEGSPYAVRIHVAVPGDDVIVDTRVSAPEIGDRPTVRRSDAKGATYRDLAVALHEAFDAARRRLRERSRLL